jgi:CBS domain containing-hemolysin-like protein
MFTLPERLFVSLLRNSNESENLNSEVQIREIIEESTKAGNIELNESKLIDNIFDFKDTIVRHVMTPRSKIISIGNDWTYSDVIETIKNEGYSRYPVFKNNLDNVIGVLHTKDIVGLNISKESIIQENIIRPTIFIKEEDFIDDLLREFQRKKIQMAVVTDEFGGTSGIITMEDILEEIVGEINDEHDEINKDIEIIDENNFIVVAAVHIRDLNEYLPEMLPESEDYESLGGLITTETESIPDLNAEIKIGNYHFLILKRTRTKIEKVKITYSPSSESDE